MKNRDIECDNCKQNLGHLNGNMLYAVEGAEVEHTGKAVGRMTVYRVLCPKCGTWTEFYL